MTHLQHGPHLPHMECPKYIPTPTVHFAICPLQLIRWFLSFTSKPLMSSTGIWWTPSFTCFLRKKVSDYDVWWAGCPMRWNLHDQSISFARAHSSFRVTLRRLSWTKWHGAVLETVDVVHRNLVETVIHMFSSEKSLIVMSAELTGRWDGTTTTNPWVLQGHSQLPEWHYAVFLEKIACCSTWSCGYTKFPSMFR
jgi:hypothetical protein